MNDRIYTNSGEEVPLGVECALPYLVLSTPLPIRGGAQRTSPPGCAIRRRQAPAWKCLTLRAR